MIYNRLADGMRLQVDATVLYGAPARCADRPSTRSTCNALRAMYNTYTTTHGLPPTPIANPGRASIQAALNPAPEPERRRAAVRRRARPTQCEYLYYVLRRATATTASPSTEAQSGRRASPPSQTCWRLTVSGRQGPARPRDRARRSPTRCRRRSTGRLRRCGRRLVVRRVRRPAGRGAAAVAATRTLGLRALGDDAA